MTEDRRSTSDNQNAEKLKDSPHLDDLFNKFDLEVSAQSSKFLLLSTTKPVRRKRKGSFVFPIDGIEVLTEQAVRDPRPLAEHYGFFTDDGYFELILATIRPGDRYTFEFSDRPRYGGLVCESTACNHNTNPFPAVYAVDDAPEEAMDALVPTEEFAHQQDASGNNRRTENRSIKPRIHLHDETVNCCIELSSASPCGILFSMPRFYISSSGFDRRYDTITTLKIQMDPARCGNNFVAKAHDIANAFLYELSVRNGIRYDPVYRPGSNHNLPLRHNERSRHVRFPRINIPAEVAQLYAFGESAELNPPLAFLSFYQVLEYYFPRAAKRITIRDLKKELVNPHFSSTDDDIVRLIGIAERGQTISEDKQIRILLESIEEEGIRSFFQSDERASHFGPNGPIKNVGHVNPNNKKDPIVNHVAGRIYALRNRIVHAKDDPKYKSKILLPRSREATLMRPDVELVKFLAQQVIIDSQV